MYRRCFKLEGQSKYLWIHAQLDYTAAVTTPAWIIVTGATIDIGPGYATNAMESDHTIM